MSFKSSNPDMDNPSKMKTRSIGTTLAFCLITFVGFSQSSIQEVALLDIEGQRVSSQDILAHDGPVLVVFWTVTCHTMIDGLTEISDEFYEGWKANSKLKIVAVSVDGARNQSKVAPFVNGKDWEFDVYLDGNEDFMRAMNADHHPFLFLLSAEGTVVWKRASFMDGDEELIDTELNKLK